MNSMQDQLKQRRKQIANNNPLSKTPLPKGPQNKNQTMLSNQSRNSLIIDYWFRTTKPSTINDNRPSDDDLKSTPNKEGQINTIIEEYCTPIFRVLPIPKESHLYSNGLANGANIFTTPEQWSVIITGIAQSQYGDNNILLGTLLSSDNPINFNEEFVVIIGSIGGSPPQSIDLKADEYEINKENNALVVTLETHLRTLDASGMMLGPCVESYYAWCIVVNKLR